MGSPLNNRSTPTEPPPKNGKQPKQQQTNKKNMVSSGGALKCILLALTLRPRFCC